MSCIQKVKDGIILKIYVQPGASLDQICGLFGDRLKIKISSPPVDGKANQQIIEFLSNFFEIKKNQFEIMRGLQSRKKDILIIADDKEIRKKLGFIGS